MDSPRRHQAPRPSFDFGPDRHTVRVVAQADQGEQQELFEGAETMHIYSVGNMTEGER